MSEKANQSTSIKEEKTAYQSCTRSEQSESSIFSSTTHHRTAAAGCQRPRRTCSPRTTTPYDRCPADDSFVKGELIRKAKVQIANTRSEDLLAKLADGETQLTAAIKNLNLYCDGSSECWIYALLLSMSTRLDLKILVTQTNSRRQSPLFLSVIAGASWLVSKLITQFPERLEVNTMAEIRDYHGNMEMLTPLQYCSKYGNRMLPVLSALLTLPSCMDGINKLSSEGMTALHYALFQHGSIDPRPTSSLKGRELIDSTRIIRKLLEACPDLSVKDLKSGKTALHFAVETGEYELVNLILSESATSHLINLPNNDHRTPLHVVAMLNKPDDIKVEIAKLLIRHGANKCSKDNSRQMPCDYVPVNQMKLQSLLQTGIVRGKSKVKESISSDMESSND